MTMSETKKQISSILVNIATEAKYSRALDNEYKNKKIYREVY